MRLGIRRPQGRGCKHIQPARSLVVIVLMEVVGFTLPEKEVLIIQGNNIRSMLRFSVLEPLIRAESSVKVSQLDVLSYQETGPDIPNKAESSCLSS